MLRINEKRAEAYKAHLLSYEVGPVNNGDSYLLPPQSLFAVTYLGEVGLRPIVLKIDVEGDDIRDATKQITRITQELGRGADILLPDGFLYKCVCDKVGKSVQVAPWILQITYSLSGFRHGPLERITVLETSNVKIMGDYKAEVKLTVETAQETVKINGISIANAAGTTIIDGIKKTVTKNGENVFGNTDMTEFPRLEAGRSTFEIVGNAKVIIEYYPVYL